MPKQSADTSGNTYGIEYNSPGQTWTVKKGVSVTGSDNGVRSDYVDSKLVNKGAIYGLDYEGVLFQGSGNISEYIIFNKKSGDIAGDSDGILINDFRGSAKIENDGFISGEDAAGIATYGSSYVDILNNGKIFGDDEGVQIEVDYAGSKNPSIKNYGSIEANYFAVDLNGTGSGLAKVTNYAGGTIRGGDYAIYSNNGAVKIKNEGKIIGDIFSDYFDDKIINKKKIGGNVDLYDGDDVVKNKDKGKITGLIDSGYGNDKLTLGQKSEKLLFDSTLDAAQNVDRIKKFESGKDMMFLDDGYFSELTPGSLSSSEFRKGTAALDSDDHIIYDKKTGSLYYDNDGVGGDGQIKFAQLDSKTKLKASDFEVGEFSI